MQPCNLVLGALTGAQPVNSSGDLREGTHWDWGLFQVVQIYKESPQVLSPAAPRGGGLRWGMPATLPQSFARVTTSMTVALHPPPLPGAYVHPAPDEPT